MKLSKEQIAAFNKSLPKMDFGAKLKERSFTTSQQMHEILTTPPPGASIPAESLKELRDMNDHVSLISDRLDVIEEHTRKESDLQKKRFRWTIIVGSISAAAAVAAAIVSVYLLVSP